MPDNNPYPAWRRRACVHCEAGLPMDVNCPGYHWRPATDMLMPKCTAPSAEEHIAALEAALRPFVDARYGESMVLLLSINYKAHFRRAKEVLDGEVFQRDADLRALVAKLEAQVAELHQRSESLNAVLQRAADEWERTAKQPQEWEMIAAMREAGR